MNREPFNSNCQPVNLVPTPSFCWRFGPILRVSVVKIFVFLSLFAAPCGLRAEIEASNQKQIELGLVIDLKDFKTHQCAEGILAATDEECHVGVLGNLRLDFLPTGNNKGILAIEARGALVFLIEASGRLIAFKKLSGGKDTKGLPSAKNVFCFWSFGSSIGLQWTGRAFRYSAGLSEACQEFGLN